MPINMEHITAPYVAGFFDGEGSVNAYRNRNGIWTIRLTFHQKRTDILFAIRDFLGYGGVMVRPNANNRLDVWGKAGVMHTVQTIYPYSQIKNKQLKLAYHLVKHVGRGPEYYPERERIGRLIQATNQAGITRRH